MGEHMELKKEAKKNRLLEAAQRLFLEKGITKTSISEITELAKVAKGTFYLYFEDKEDLHRQLIYQISHDIIHEAFTYTERRRTDSFAENVIFFADWIIVYFTEHTEILRLVKRGFSWPLLTQSLIDRIDSTEDPMWHEIAQRLNSSSLAEGHNRQEVYNTFFVIIEMCGVTCYSSIIESQPDSIENMKPILYSMIRKILAE